MHDSAFAPREMDESFRVERQIQPASPVFQQRQEVLSEDLIGLVPLLPIIPLDGKRGVARLG